MRVLVVGRNASEHALALNLSLSEFVSEVYCCPGNPGISEVATCLDIHETNFEEIKNLVLEEKIDFVITGSSKLHAQGITDYLEKYDINVFAPSQETAKIEWSKYFAKEFMLRREIPSPRYVAFDKREFALAYAQSQKLPIVIKANGLTDSSSSVSIINSYEGAIGAINACFEGRFGSAGSTVIIEEYIEPSEEFNFPVLVYNDKYTILPPVRVFHQLYGEGQGPYTKGMASVSPYNNISQKLLNHIEDTLIKPFIYGMKEEARPYKGFLNFKIILDQNKYPYIIDLNTSLDSVIASTSLLLLEEDLVNIINNIATQTAQEYKYQGYIKSIKHAQSDEQAHTACIALAGEGYPGATVNNLPVRFIGNNIQRGKYSQIILEDGSLDEYNAQCLLLHDNTQIDKNNNLATGEGRVFICTAIADTKENAFKALNSIALQIDFPGKTMYGKNN